MTGWNTTNGSSCTLEREFIGGVSNHITSSLLLLPCSHTHTHAHTCIGLQWLYSLRWIGSQRMPNMPFAGPWRSTWPAVGWSCAATPPARSSRPSGADVLGSEWLHHPWMRSGKIASEGCCPVFWNGALALFLARSAPYYSRHVRRSHLACLQNWPGELRKNHDGIWERLFWSVKLAEYSSMFVL